MEIYMFIIVLLDSSKAFDDVGKEWVIANLLVNYFLEITLINRCRMYLSQIFFPHQ